MATCFSLCRTNTNTLLDAHSIILFVVSLATYGTGRVAMHLEVHIGEIAHVLVIELRPDKAGFSLHDARMPVPSMCIARKDVN